MYEEKSGKNLASWVSAVLELSGWHDDPFASDQDALASWQAVGEFRCAGLGIEVPTRDVGRARAYSTSDEGRRSMDENRGKAVRLHIVIDLVGRDGL